MTFLQHVANSRFVDFVTSKDPISNFAVDPNPSSSVLEYMESLKELQGSPVPTFVKGDRTLTFVYKSDISEKLSLQETFTKLEQLRIYAENNDLVQLILFCRPLMQNGIDLQRVSMLIGKAFKNSKVKAVIG